MKNSILRCIEDIETSILELEDKGHSPESVRRVYENLGLSHLKLPSARVLALLDLFEDGITPLTPEIVSSLLCLLDAQKRLLFNMAGIVEDHSELSSEPDAAQAPDVQTPDTPAVDKEDEQCRAREKTGEAQDMPAYEDQPPQDAEHPPAAAEAKQGMQPEAITSIRVNTAKLDNLIDLVGKLMVTHAVVAQNSEQTDNGASAGFRDLDLIIDRIKSEVERIRLVPLKQIVMPMNRLINSLSVKVGKKVRFDILGGDVELDKQVVEYLNEPLVHLLRNALDHGLESPEQRKKAGKEETGSITFRAARTSDNAVIRVSDDGKGLDRGVIEKKARKMGLIEEGAEYSDADIFRFIFHSGLSTASKVTDVSGRGVGMDAVLSAIQGQLGGDVSIDSTPGAGTTFEINIPLSRSMNQGIVDALVIKVGGQKFIVPSRDVVEVYSPAPNEFVSLHDGRESVSVRDKLHTLARLSEVFGLGGEAAPDPQAVIISSAERTLAILVDEVLKQQQIVVTPFTIPVADIYRLPIAGFGMMGEEDALVVDTEQLLRLLEREDETADKD